MCNILLELNHKEQEAKEKFVEFHREDLAIRLWQVYGGN
jgi:hypothetical protein